MKLRVLLLLLLLVAVILFSSVDFSLASFDEISVASSAHSIKLQLPSGKPVNNSPGARPGSATACNRVIISGLSRFRNPNKFAHSVKIRVSVEQADGFLRSQNVDVCLHRNESIGLGMCPDSQWQKLSKAQWVQSVSPFANMILDIRRPIDFAKPIEVSAEEEFLFHRVVFLVVGMVLMAVARVLSESVVFYYGGAMAGGIILVILMVLFQGMRLLPTGRKSSLAIFMYSSIVGVATSVLHYISGLLRSLLVEIGITEDLHNPLGVYLLVCFVLAGAWCGYWGVRKLVLTEEGLVDADVAYFVEWAILIFSGVMILQCSFDTFIAAEALAFAIIISAVTRTHGKCKFFRHVLRRIAKNISRNQVQISPSRYHSAEHHHQNQKSWTKLRRSEGEHLNMGPFISPTQGSRPTPSSKEETFYSTFHNTPERKKFSSEEWKEFTEDQTNEALKELVSSPDFNRWASANAGRLILSPPGYYEKPKRRRWFF